ncbi:MAG: hypothetical protein M1834_004609 [Cirrosporium novae-zelandiae]|nr:MAG: hypothetical protein M1834_004609 [Cirrosporium novae-zelandiae]
MSILSRASRIRCDGQERCSNCINKNHKCEYAPSKRGGPRVYKKKTPARNNIENEGRDTTTAEPDVDLETWFNSLDCIKNSGFGLATVGTPNNSSIDGMFDNIFFPKEQYTDSNPTPPKTSSFVRVYGNDRDILDAYYIFIHPYFPVLAPPLTCPPADRPLNGLDYPQRFPLNEASELKSSSPLSLAISAILALIPHPADQDYSKPESVQLRRAYAQSFAQYALNSIEIESEMTESNINPAKALSDGSPTGLDCRTPFHSRTPIILEPIITLCILSVYEYAQRGNLTKMRSRVAQALFVAKDMGLHSLGLEDDGFAEARRRAWWMTPPIIDVYDSEFTTPFPTFLSDPGAWGFFIRAQRAILSGTMFCHDLDKCLKTKSNLSWIPERMERITQETDELLSHVGPVLFESPPTVALIDPTEAVMATSMRSISRIKIYRRDCILHDIKAHRFCAFSDIPIFVKRHCDFEPVNNKTTTQIQLAPSQIPFKATTQLCSCNGLVQSVRSISSTMNMPGSASSPTSLSSPDSILSELGMSFPYTSYTSSKTCLKAALGIAHTINELPYPYTSSEASPGNAPRTMPAFACCAMQSSYVMLMLCYKAQTVQYSTPTDNDGHHSLVDDFLESVHKGLQYIVDALANYATAFEAIGGMRDEIENALEIAFLDF